MKYLLLSLLFIAKFSFATSIKGQVTDEKQQPLAYATIFLKNTTIGTTSNEDGFYSLDAQPGTYEIVFQYLGYEKYSKEITVGENTVTLNVILKIESVSLKEVTVNSGAEDPAYEIIRQAQRKRKYYLNQINAYSCNVYIKGIQGLDKIPDKIFGVKAEKLDVDSSLLGILYLSESESEYNFEKPGKVKEIVYSSKVSGDNNAFSWNSATAFSSDFYENIIPLEAITPRGLISPIADGAFTFYKYHLLGTFYDEGLLINKIQVIPKRNTDPVFSGTIYIIEDQWRIHSLDLLVTKEAHLDFVDSLRFKETYGKVNDTAWMPFNQLLQFKISVFGFSGDGSFLGVFSHYNLHVSFGKDFFDAQELKVNDDANKKDSLYWIEHRPVPLTITEKNDYHKKDSIHIVHTSEEYLDSVDRKRNKFKFDDLLTGYEYDNSYKRWRYSISSPLFGINYNPVEGLDLMLNNTFEKRFEDNTSWNLEGDLRYGFSNQHFGARLGYSRSDDPIHKQRWKAEAGVFTKQINEEEPIFETLNSAYALFSAKNFMKIYEKRWATFAYKRELFNGFLADVSLTYADRFPLENTTNYTFKKTEDEFAFEPNNEFNNPHADTLMRSQALILDIKTDITIGQKYISRPHAKINTGSKFPTFTLEYAKGIYAFGSDVNFDVLQAGLTHTLNFGMVGKGNVNVSAGIFLNHYQTTFIDFKHFQGNQTAFSSHYTDGYQLLPYYNYSTNDSWLEGHYEHHFGGFIFNKIPLIKKLGMQEVAGGHLLLTPDITYFELDVGIEHILKFLRLDYVTSFDNQGRIHNGFLIGLSSAFISRE